jgi:hypothetical protein
MALPGRGHREADYHSEKRSRGEIRERKRRDENKKKKRICNKRRESPCPNLSTHTSHQCNELLQTLE